jgi:group I intron endonuclease
MIGIYKITSPNNRVYIGQSVDIERRFRFYKHLNCKKQPILYASFLKYGVSSHIFEILEECSLNELNHKERYWQNYYNVLNGGLNCNLVATDIEHKRHSQDTKDKIAKSHTGKKFTDIHKQNLSTTKLLTSNGSDNNFYGKQHTCEFKQDRSIKRTGSGNPKAKIVLNLETGIYYECSKDAANVCNINYNTFKSWLSGLYINKSSFIYV